jgi:hypothetical protein
MSEEEKASVRMNNRDIGSSEYAVKPIILEYKKLKKKKQSVATESSDNSKEKYSKGLEDIQRLESNVVRITQKATKALSKGVDVYEKEREKSAREKTDGAIEDFINNSAKATSAYLKEASDIPIDLAESVSTDSYRKRLRKNLRQASKFLRLWRI